MRRKKQQCQLGCVLPIHGRGEVGMTTGTMEVLAEIALQGVCCHA